QFKGDEMSEDKKQLPAAAQPPHAQTLFAPRTGAETAFEKRDEARAYALVGALFQKARIDRRDEAVCLKKMLALAENVYFASDALYKVKRGTDKVKGLSIK